MKKNKHLENIVKKLVKSSFKDERIIESNVTKSIKILKSLPKTQAIQALSEYLKAFKRRERMHTLFIETAVPLSALQVKKAKNIVEKKVRISKVLVKENPEILGGFKIRVGDDIWDYSVLGQMEKVKEAITHGRLGE